ncbi:hypothetical protein C8Q75DRAFT_544411 [Abortiporus biennis]|nr:hypothetical protein C8Q75DRAFT_544411 [Abortiporus biennis]
MYHRSPASVGISTSPCQRHSAALSQTCICITFSAMMATIEVPSDPFGKGQMASVHHSFQAVDIFQLLNNNIQNLVRMSVERLCSESSTCEHIAKPEYYTRAMFKAHGGYSLVLFLPPQDTDLSHGHQGYRRRFCDIGIDSIHDFDLSTSGAGSMGNMRMGTQPFMAMDLLEKAGRKDGIPHLYRHDLESFIWLLVWYSKPETKTYGRPLATNSWATSTAEYCLKDKNAFWTNYTKYTSDTQEKLFFVTRNLIYAMNKTVFRPMADAEEYEQGFDQFQSSEELPPFSEPSPYELFEALQEIVFARYGFLSGLDSSPLERMKGKEGDKK